MRLPLPQRLLFLIPLWLLATALRAEVPAVNPAFPNNLSGTPGTLLFRQINLNRVTNIAYHNGLIYTHEVAAANPRRWRFTDINDPASLTNEAVGWQNVGNFSDHGTHGHYKVGDWLGGQWTANIRRVSPGVNTLQEMPGFNYLAATQPGDEITRMYYPWALGFNWIEYQARTGYGYLYRGTETNGQPLMQWPALAQHGVAGNSILLGNLLFITSDESNMGVLCYDISPVFASPAQPPVLLDKLSGPIGAYICSAWQNYLVFARRDTSSLDVVDYSDPTDLRFVTSISTSGHANWDRGNGLGYVQAQDNFIFTDRHKINMETFQSVLELDEMDVGGRPAGSVAGQLDTSQHLMPMGNLLVSGGYSVSGADGVGVWIHSATPDRNPPYVGYHIPRPGQTNFPRGAPISLLIHENLESFTIINGETVILRRADQATPVPATVSFSYDDVLTITPDQYLETDQTYVVEIVPNGIKDVAGNGILGYSFTFSTGNSVAGGNASPVITTFQANPSPAIPGSEVSFTAAATDADAGDTLEYRFTFGDAGSVRDWSPSPTATHTYATTGHYGVKVQVRDVRTGAALSTVSQTGTVTIVPAPPAARPSKSSPIALDATARHIWVVNPDNDSVSVIHADTLTRLAEHDLGSILGLSGRVDPRSVAMDSNGNAWITCRDANRLVILDASGALVQSVAFDYGSAPMGVAISPDGSSAYVALEGKGRVLRFNTSTRAQTDNLAVGPMPRAIAITANGARVLVTRFISGEEYGQVYDVNASGASLVLTRIIPLHRDRGGDGSSSGRGVPNYVSSITITPDGAYAYYTAIKSNTHRGTFFDQGQDTNDPLDPDNTIRAMVGRIDMAATQQPFEPFSGNTDSYRIDVDNSESPTSIEFTPGGDYFFLTVQGNNHIAVFDDLLLRTAPRSAGVKTTKGRFPTGLAPQGLAFDPATNRLFSADFMGRSVTVHQLGDFLSFGSRETSRVAIPTITTDKLSPQVLLGKRIFYQSADGSGLSTLPMMSLEGYISCASCHVDGQHDGMTWDFTQRGEGLRNTTDLRGRGGMAHGNVHWTANFDEIQDFVLDVVTQFGGEGLLPEGQTPNPSLGAPNAGRSAELDALAAYLTSLESTHLPPSPHRNTDGSRTANAAEGEAIFIAQNCASCHSGPNFTDSTVGPGLLHDVGTLRTSSGQRLSATLTGIDTPSLLSLWSSAPYFHDGSAKTLAEVFRVAGGTLYQAEAATPSANVYPAGYPRLNEDSSMHGQMAYLQNGGSVTFNNIDGGSGGTGDLEVRWLAPYWNSPGSITVTVNGVAHVQAVTRPFGSGQPGDHWQRLRFENVALTAGTSNTIVITTSSADYSGFDDLLVTTADDRTAAFAHRRVLSLSQMDQDRLSDYLLQLDSSDTSPVTNPTVAITLSPGQDASSSRPYAEFDVTFSEAIQGLTEGDFSRGGTAGSSTSLLTPLMPGTHYRLRVAGFTQAGTVTLQLPGGVVTALDDGVANFGSNAALVTYTLPTVDDIAPLSDEFNSSGTQPNWQRVSSTEGWGPSKLETWDINTSRPGHMRLIPYASSWYQNWTGEMVFKPVTGNFVATLRMQAQRRNGQPGRPTSLYSLGGIMVRTPHAYSNASPVPDPGPTVVLPYPPPAFGQPNHYTTPWTPGTENYIFLSYGYADASAWGNVPNTWYCEVKTTIDSDSTLYAVQSGIPADTDLVTLQMVRVGQTFVVMRRHGEAGPWIIENRYQRADMPQTLQLGVTTYTDWDTVDNMNVFHHNRTVVTTGNPDLVVDADYFRVRRPDSGVTELLLQGLDTTRSAGSVVQLSSTAAASLLGDNAHAAYTEPGQDYHAWLRSRLSPAQMLLANHTDLDGEANDDGTPNLAHFALGSVSGKPLSIEVSGPPENSTTALRFTRNTEARGVTLIIESTNDFSTWTPLATSTDGAACTGSATITEGTGLTRNVLLEHPTPLTPTFYRIRAILNNTSP